MNYSQDSQRLYWNNVKDVAVKYLLGVLAYFNIFITFVISFILLSESLSFFSKVNWYNFLTGTTWEPFATVKQFGVLPLVAGSMMITVGACLFAVPLGLGIAIYLNQYASPNFKNLISVMIEIFSAIPSVVYGYFALNSVTPFLRLFFPQIEVFNAFSASIVVGLAILPIIASISADSLNYVPRALQDAGYALGMRKYMVVTKILLPAAASGIASSIILGFARAIGETMAVTIAAGATPNMSLNYFAGVQTITAFIVQVSLGDVPLNSVEYYAIYALALVLFIITFSFNQIANQITKKYRLRYE